MILISYPEGKYLTIGKMTYTGFSFISRVLQGQWCQLLLNNWCKLFKRCVQFNLVRMVISSLIRYSWTCRGRSLGFLRLGWTLAFEFEPARGSGTIFPEMYPTFLSAKNNPLRNRIYFPWPQERAAKFATKCTTPFKAQKITPYKGEFIFRGLRKRRPNLHRNVCHRFKYKK